MSGFELRFEERPDPTSQKGTQMVLQYRTKTVHVDSPTTTPVEPAWTEWKDVPIVKQAKESWHDTRTRIGAGGRGMKQSQQNN